MEIALKNLHKKIPLNLLRIKKIAQAILQNEGVKHATLSIVFVTRQKIQALNKKFLKKSYATDVLAFDLSLDIKEEDGRGAIVGEIIISIDQAFKNAKEYDVSVGEEIVLYVIHGILHLLGYDDHKANDIKKMRKREQELLKLLGKEINGVVEGARKKKVRSKKSNKQSACRRTGE